MCLFWRLLTINITSKTREQEYFFQIFSLTVIFLIVFPMIYFKLQTGFSFTEQRFGRYKSFYVSFIDY